MLVIGQGLSGGEPECRLRDREVTVWEWTKNGTLGTVIRAYEMRRVGTILGQSHKSLVQVYASSH